MENLFAAIVALLFLAVKGLVFFAFVYAGARLAIRHERRFPG